MIAGDDAPQAVAALGAGKADKRLQNAEKPCAGHVEIGKGKHKREWSMANGRRKGKSKTSGWEITSYECFAFIPLLNHLCVGFRLSSVLCCGYVCIVSEPSVARFRREKQRKA